jgi:hypothetical protein
MCQPALGKRGEIYVLIIEDFIPLLEFIYLHKKALRANK